MRAARAALALLMVVLLLTPGLTSLTRTVASPGEEEREAGDMDPTVNTYLYHAEAGARWLISVAEEPTPGHYKWHASDVEDGYYYLGLSSGAAGIGGFFLDLYNATGNETYLEYAEGAARWVISLAVQEGADACKWPFMEGWAMYDYDKFSGVGGIGEFLLDLHIVTGKDTYLDHSMKGANWLIDQAVSEHGGYKWGMSPGSTTNFTGWAHGVAGIGDFFRKLGDETGNRTYLETAGRCAAWLMATAREPAVDQYTWVRIETDADPSITWCGGTTGIVLFFMLMYESTGNQTYLDHARGGANWMIAQAVRTGPGETSIYPYNIFCHGNPSSSWVLFKLYDLTEDITYLEYAESTANWTMSSAVEVNEHETKWRHLGNSGDFITGLLMGVSGVGHQMLYAHQITGKDKYVKLARKAANWVVNTSIEVEPGIEKWNYREGMDSDQEYCTNWYWGVAGIGTFLVEMAPQWVQPDFHGIDIPEEDLEGSAVPGGTVTYRFNVTNTGNVADGLDIHIPAPAEGWSAVADHDEGDVGPGEKVPVTVEVGPPSGATAGSSDTLVLTARSAGDGTKEDNITITTTVEAVYGVDLSVDDLEGRAPPGGEARYDLTVINTGNAVDDLVLGHTGAPEGWQVDLTFDGRGTGMGEEREAAVRVVAPEDAPVDRNMTLVLTAGSGNDPSIERVLDITTTVTQVFGLEVEVRGDLTMTTGPGRAAAFVLGVTNGGNGPDDLYLEAGDIEGWDLEVEFDGDAIARGETREALIRVTPPPGTLAGSMGTVPVTVTSAGDPETERDLELTVEVSRVAGLEVEVPDGEEGTVMPGERAAYELVMRNTGNGEDGFVIEVSSDLGWDVVLGEGNTTDALGPGERTTVTVWVQAPSPEEALAGTTDRSEVRVGSTTVPGLHETLTLATTVLEVIDLELTAGQDRTRVRRGENAAFNLTVANRGNGDRTVTVGVDPDRASISDSSLEVPAGGTADLVLRTGALNTTGNQTFEVVVRSGDVTERVTLAVWVIEAGEDDGTGGPSDDRGTHMDSMLPWALALLLVVVVAVAAVMVLFKQRGKEDGPGR